MWTPEEFEGAAPWIERAAIVVCQIDLILFSCWGFYTIAQEVNAADPTYAVPAYLVYGAAIGVVVFALALWIRHWTPRAGPGLLPFVVLAVLPVLIICAIVSLRPNHAYRQRPVITLRDVLR